MTTQDNDLTVVKLSLYRTPHSWAPFGLKKEKKQRQITPFNKFNIGKEVFHYNQYVSTEVNVVLQKPIYRP